MASNLQPAYKTEWVNAAVTPEMKEQVEAFARENRVSQSQALRFMIETFFKSDYQKKQVNNQK